MRFVTIMRFLLCTILFSTGCSQETPAGPEQSNEIVENGTEQKENFPPPEEVPPPKLKLSSRELMREFALRPKETLAAYQGKVVEVTGTVMSVYSDYEQNLWLDGSNGVRSWSERLMCRFSDDVGNLRIFQAVTLRGTVTYDNLGDAFLNPKTFYLKDCRVISSAETPEMYAEDENWSSAAMRPRMQEAESIDQELELLNINFYADPTYDSSTNMPGGRLEVSAAYLTEQGTIKPEVLALLKKIQIPLSLTFADDTRTMLTDAAMMQLAEIDWVWELYLFAPRDPEEFKLTSQSLEAIGKMARLRRLHLSGGWFDDAGLFHLKSLTKLEHLALSGERMQEGNITDASFKTLNFPVIKEAQIESAEITDASLLAFSRSPYLRNLKFERTQVTGTGFETFPEELLIREIVCKDSRASDAGLKAISQFKWLGFLDLSYWTAESSASQITDAGTKWLADHPLLTSLDLAGAEVTDETLKTLSTCQLLVRIDLQRSKITETGVNYLIDHAKNLKELRLPRPLNTEAIRKRIRAKFPEIDLGDVFGF